jgi:hypothetical protein
MTIATGSYAQFSSDPAGDRRARLGALILYGLKTKDAGTADALAREVLLSLQELGPLDRANWRLSKTSVTNEKMKAALEQAPSRDIIELDSGYVTIAEALSIEARRATTLHKLPEERYKRGYCDACETFISRIDARCQEIEAGDYNLVRGSEGGSSSTDSIEFSSEYASLEAEIAELPEDESSLKEHQTQRVHQILRRYHRYIGISVDASVARVLVESLSELSALKIVLARLAASERLGRQLRAKLAMQCGLDDPAEISWRETLANELSRFAQETSVGSGTVGDDYALGYNLAIKRICTALRERADGIRAVSFAD